MRTLTPAPASAVDPATGEPNTGSFLGAIPHVDLRGLVRGRARRLAQEKRWLYGAIVSDALYLGFAVVDLGYASKAFAYALVRDGRRFAVDTSLLGPPLLGRVRQTRSLRYAAHFRSPRGRVSIEQPRDRPTMTVDLRVRGLEVHARLDAEAAPPSLTAVARVDGGVVNVTEKRLLLPASGWADVQGTRHDLTGALAGYDYTHGLLARRTSWRWGFFLGRAADGAPVGMNVVEGFVGEPECAVWIGDAVYPTAEGRFRFDRDAPLEDWHVRTADDAVDLTFSPGAVHMEREDLGVVASRFVQPVGVYRGALRVPGRAPVTVDAALGVAEDQDVLW